MHSYRSLGIYLAVVLGLVVSANAWGESKEMDKRFYIAPMVSYGFFDSDSTAGTTVDPDDKVGGTLAIGKPIGHPLNLEAYGFLFNNVDDNNSGQDGDLSGYGLDALLFPARDTFPIYGILGVAIGDYDFSGSGGVFNAGDGDADYLDAGVGYMQKLNHYGLALRAEYRYRHASVEVRNAQDLHFNDHIVSLGLQIPLGAPPAEPEPEHEAQPAPPPPAPEPQDSDNDGVIDKNDECPGTPAGTEVNAKGCPVEKKAPIVLKGVHFEYDSAKLTADAERRLDNVVNALKASTDIEVRIEGHTDSKGTDAYNMRLSDQRAASVKRYLVEHGIPADRLTSKGYGETEPVAPNTNPDGSDNPEGRAKNRRVELEVTNQ